MTDCNNDIVIIMQTKNTIPVETTYLKMKQFNCEIVIDNKVYIIMDNLKLKYKETLYNKREYNDYIYTFIINSDTFTINNQPLSESLLELNSISSIV